MTRFKFMVFNPDTLRDEGRYSMVTDVFADFDVIALPGSRIPALSSTVATKALDATLVMGGPPLLIRMPVFALFSRKRFFCQFSSPPIY